MQQRSSNNSEKYYESKYRRLAIYNSDNYSDWLRTSEAVLTVSGALLFVEGEQEEEENKYNRKYVTVGIKILFNSVSAPY